MSSQALRGLLMVPKQREQNDDWEWYAYEPEQQSTAETHCFLLH
jgi:hypothetical protein